MNFIDSILTSGSFADILLLDQKNNSQYRIKQHIPYFECWRTKEVNGGKLEHTGVLNYQQKLSWNILWHRNVFVNKHMFPMGMFSHIILYHCVQNQFLQAGKRPHIIA